jgi:hypothetical protein
LETDGQCQWRTDGAFGTQIAKLQSDLKSMSQSELQKVFNIANEVFSRVDRFPWSEEELENFILRVASSGTLSDDGFEMFEDMVENAFYIGYCSSECLNNIDSKCQRLVLRNSVQRILELQYTFPFQIAAAVQNELVLNSNWSIIQAGVFMSLSVFAMVRAELFLLSHIDDGTFDAATMLKSDNRDRSIVGEVIPIGYLALDSVKECAICMEKTGISVACCRQPMHVECLLKWLLDKVPVNRECPTCRSPCLNTTH